MEKIHNETYNESHDIHLIPVFPLISFKYKILF